MSIAIKAENISKAYQLGEIGTGTLSHDLERWISRVRGKGDPFLRIGETNDRTTKGKSDVVWSLKDINFEIEQGDAVGIIGRNGAGKSTLLKILSRVTSPTTGRIKGKGRIASLLEVGTGFHPELTGRENIYLNGAILGMRKREITRKFDEIVNFAGVERYIDTPVKRYSSGMYVRLAFAVAAHLESEILVVDEVLAVGDAEFQKKCLGKMGEVSKGEGRTVLFVSHNLNSVNSFCKTGIFLSQGSTYAIGDMHRISELYTELLIENAHSVKKKKNNLNKKAWLKSFTIKNDLTNEHNIEVNQNCIIALCIESNINLKSVYIGIGINDRTGQRLFTLYSQHYSKSYDLSIGENNLNCKIENFPLKPGIYLVEIFIGNNYETYDYSTEDLRFEVVESPMNTRGIPDSSQGSFMIPHVWE